MKNLSIAKSILLLTVIVMLRINNSTAQAWVSTDNGFSIAGVSSFLTIGNKIYASSDADGVYVTNNDSINWTEMNNGLTSTYIRSIFSYGNNLYAGSYGNGAFISYDGGNNWAPKDTGFMQGIEYVNVFASIDTFLLTGTNDAAYYSTDSGLHWHMTYLSIQEVYAFAVSGNIIYAGSSYGMHKSLDSGVTWVEINNGLPSETVTHIVVSGSKILCAVNLDRIYASVDNGATWTSSSSGINSSANVKALFADGDTVYAGTDTYGIYRSTDNGATWTQYNLGQNFPIVTAFCKSGGTIYAGTNVSGVFKLAPVANGIADIPSSSLHLFPNPATDEIFIQDDLNKKNEVRIVDAIGRCVLSFAMKGEASKKISVQNLAPGIYTVIADGAAMRFEKY